MRCYCLQCRGQIDPVSDTTLRRHKQDDIDGKGYTVEQKGAGDSSPVAVGGSADEGFDVEISYVDSDSSDESSDESSDDSEADDSEGDELDGYEGDDVFDSDEEEGFAPLDQFDVLEHHCQKLVDLVANNLITQAGVEAMLKLEVETLVDLCPGMEVNWPSSWYMVQQLAGVSSTGSVLLDTCPADCCVYGKESELKACPECTAPRTTERQILLRDVERTIQNMFKIPELAKAMTYPNSEECMSNDVWVNGSLQHTSEQQRSDTLYLSMSSDSCVLQGWKGKSFTPVVCRIMNLPPHLRHTFAGFLLLGMLPPKVRNYPLFYKTVLAQLHKYTKEGGEGIQVWDSHLKKGRTIKLDLHMVLEDLRGLPNVTGSKQAPSIVGACPYCEIMGYTCHGTTVYPGAISYSTDPHLIERFRTEFEAVKPIQERANAKTNTKPTKMTTLKAIRSAKTVLGKRTASERKKEEKNQSYKTISPIIDMYGENWDLVNNIAVDSAHTFGNVVSDIIALISNKKKMQWKGKRKAIEKNKRKRMMALFGKKGAATKAKKAP
jgi:hypothetical protein